ncbi:hypothetical protein A6R68_13275 [Neotoma lepida]|uniref:Uncharacterized protein n=1 Tax=Neotoma lepida TaxID=56216 RepID=A0A1A6H0N2_NEOLE|nr:hypothetical protein A6R68_13275 [Neotoma lepida]
MDTSPVTGQDTRLLLDIATQAQQPTMLQRQWQEPCGRADRRAGTTAETAAAAEHALETFFFKERKSEKERKEKIENRTGVPFPKNFMSVAKTILKRLFRVYAHIYHQHFDPVIQLQEEAHLNTSFKHFIFFVQEFNLIDRRELAPLQELIEKLTSKDR